MSDAGEKLDLKIPQGATFERVIRWEKRPFIWKAITNITRSGPARITATGHGVPDAWRVAVTAVLGMRQINSENWPPKEADFHRATYVDANTIELNEVNAAVMSAYSSGGYVVYNTPASLASCVARMTIRDRIGGTALLELDSALLGGLELDDSAKTITLTLEDDDVAAYDWTKGVYDLEIEDADGKTHRLYYGSVSITPKEVTT